MRTARLVIGVATVTLTGCVDLFSLEDDGGFRPTLNLTTLGIDSESTYFESVPNEQLDEAELVALAGEPRVIRGLLTDENDVDVYDLGPVAFGDRVVVDMTTTAALDGAIALFDSAGTALLVNDHRNVYLGTTTPFIDVVIQRPSRACYVAVSTTPGYLADDEEYALLASRTFPTEPPPLRPDDILLVFSGGQSVRVGGRAPVDIPVFDAASISDDFTGEDETMMAEIVAGVREDFEGYDVNILSTSEGATFEAGMTRIYFGMFDEALLGVAEGVDEFNGRRGQVAIVFTDTFNAFTRLDPSVEQMGQAIANVASHEIGHLLGMVHTHDPEGIMDVTASLKRLMQDQAFSRSPLYQAVFPLGFQDALSYLLDTVGGNTNVINQKLVSRRSQQWKSGDGEGLPARATLKLSGCCLTH